jgi:hypothetical protein
MGGITGGEVMDATNGRESTDVAAWVSFFVAWVESRVPSGSVEDAVGNDSVVSGVILYSNTSLPTAHKSFKVLAQLKVLSFSV